MTGRQGAGTTVADPITTDPTIATRTMTAGATIDEAMTAGLMTVGMTAGATIDEVMTVGVMTAGAMTVGVMTVGMVAVETAMPTIPRITMVMEGTTPMTVTTTIMPRTDHPCPTNAMGMAVGAVGHVTVLVVVVVVSHPTNDLTIFLSKKSPSVQGWTQVRPIVHLTLIST